MPPGDSPLHKQAKAREDQRPVSFFDFVVKPATASEVPAQKIVVKTNMMRPIYVSSFAPTATPATVMSFFELNEDLKYIVPNIECIALKKRRQSVSFLSFRLNVPRH